MNPPATYPEPAHAAGLAVEHGHGHGHGNGHHDPHLAHHFDSTEQQFEADKLGMWVFLVTEILFFSGLFCAYAVYRANHPEIFEYAHLFLNRTLGAINTVVLLFSSLTMAWGVRCAQLSQPKGLRVCLALTLLCAFGFLGIKYVEYKNKWEEGLLWGERFHPTEEALAHIAHLAGEHGGVHADHMPTGSASAPETHASLGTPSDSSAGVAPVKHADNPKVEAAKVAIAKAEVPKDAAAKADALKADVARASVKADPSKAEVAKAGIVKPDAPKVEVAKVEAPRHAAGPVQPDHTSIFFGIYFCMTGLHGIHILVGIGLISWLLVRSMRGEFTDGYYTPVDLVGLYWHIVDLVWIYLFPLLYLIH